MYVGRQKKSSSLNSYIIFNMGTFEAFIIGSFQRKYKLSK